MQNQKFFPSVSQLRKWFEKNHDKVQELWICFYNKRSGKKAVSYKEALDEALCFGWIDGIRKSIDEHSYTNRFTPRKNKSIWSNVNTKRFEELMKIGKVHATGLKTFEKREDKRAGVYSFEKNAHTLLPAYEKKFKANKKAWKFFTSRPPWYQRTAIHLVMSAKQEATQLRRLETLIDDSANERTISQLTRKEIR